MNKCKFCGKEQTKPLSLGYCISCYQYFILHNYKTWLPSSYGSISYVGDINSNQYGMPICHICGKSFTKLQQHIWYQHNMTKNEYCDLFGLDHKIRLTEKSYNEKMRNHAIENNMNVTLKEKGKNTQFKKGHSRNYKRSYQTKRRLSLQGILIGKQYGGNLKKNEENNS